MKEMFSGDLSKDLFAAYPNNLSDLLLALRVSTGVQDSSIYAIFLSDKSCWSF